LWSFENLLKFEVCVTNFILGCTIIFGLLKKSRFQKFSKSADFSYSGFFDMGNSNLKELGDFNHLRTSTLVTDGWLDSRKKL
jgi:hypothetical protein